jgi:hypothetical protein
METEFWKWIKNAALTFKGKAISKMLKVDDLGLSIYQESMPTVRIAWSDIAEIIAYKMDLLTEDLICFELRVISNEMPLTYVLSEEIEGFAEAEKALERFLPHFDSTWRAKIVRPAFASNRVRLFLRD